jgi:hypothetical protein
VPPPSFSILDPATKTKARRFPVKLRRKRGHAARAVGRRRCAHPPVEEKAAAAPSRHARTASPCRPRSRHRPSPLRPSARGGEGRRRAIAPHARTALPSVPARGGRRPLPRRRHARTIAGRRVVAPAEKSVTAAVEPSPEKTGVAAVCLPAVMAPPPVLI